ncbi:NAD(P)-dependent oxidoreductase [Streptomyces sp. NPDC020965]|uniref:NAD(P)-dependent oxidoreductase n=1 Tax=Streptomyces sp. NPDC020965 TaxID=3365105 RepID=UPI0037A6524C
MSPHPSPHGAPAPGTVTVLGLGQLGTVVARAFITAGHRTTVWNRTPGKADELVAAGAVPAVSLTDAITASAVVVVVLPDDATTRELLEPVAGALRGRVLVNLTSGTPETARDTARWARTAGAAYLDGAAMSGTRLVGRPEALFVLSGSATAYATHAPLLAALGNAVHLGNDPGHASLYDTALFGTVWGAVAGFHHALALTGTEGVAAPEFAAVATDYLPFVATLFTEHARQIAAGDYPDDDGTVDVHTAAMEHLVHTSRARGIGTEVPDLLVTLLRRTGAAGHGAEGIARVATVVAKGPDHG